MCHQERMAKGLLVALPPLVSSVQPILKDSFLSLSAKAMLTAFWIAFPLGVEQL